MKVFIDGGEDCKFQCRGFEELPCCAAAWAGSLRHQWCIVAVRSASLFLMDILQAVKGRRAAVLLASIIGVVGLVLSICISRTLNRLYNMVSLHWSLRSTF